MEGADRWTAAHSIKRRACVVTVSAGRELVGANIAAAQFPDAGKGHNQIIRRERKIAELAMENTPGATVQHLYVTPKKAVPDAAYRAQVRIIIDPGPSQMGNDLIGDETGD